MSEQTRPCENCGSPRKIKLIDFMGMKREITLACPPCEAKRDAKARERNLKTVLSLTEDWSIKDCEADDWTLDSHPDPEAREFARGVLETFPRPLEDLLAMRDWSTAAPDDLALLRGAQRNAMKKRPGILFVGKPGRGKSGLASAIHREMRARGVPGCQVNIAVLFNEMRGRYGDSSRGTVEQLLQPLRMTPLLTLDDLDKLHARGSNDEILKLYDIVQTRIAQQMPIMLTANSTLRELAQKLEGFGEDGAAIVDRLAKTTPLSFPLKSPISFRRMESSHLQPVDA